jgi:hypothetical protein
MGMRSARSGTGHRWWWVVVDNRGMALLRVTDLSPADWISGSDVAWSQLVTFGPPGFGAYARLRFLRDPAYEGETEVEAGRTAIGDGRDQWPTLAETLAPYTRTADDCYFYLWEGWPLMSVDGCRPRGSVGTALSGPKVTVPRRAAVPARAYFLFRGPLSDIGGWSDPEIVPGELEGLEPAFIWPTDQAWCVANDVDPHWAGIGADPSLIQRLLIEPRLDCVEADPTAEQPAYR